MYQDALGCLKKKRAVLLYLYHVRPEVNVLTASAVLWNNLPLPFPVKLPPWRRRNLEFWRCTDYDIPVYDNEERFGAVGSGGVTGVAYDRRRGATRLRSSSQESYCSSSNSSS